MYMAVDEIETRAQLFAEQFPALVTVTTLPETTAGGRPTQLIRVAAGPSAPKHALYVQAGIHAREWGTVVRDVRIVRCTLTGCSVASGACVAPTFRATQSSLACLLLAIVYSIVIAVLAIFAWIPSINCRIRQVAFRIAHCRDGNADPCRTV
jgi:hypothetical protein